MYSMSISILDERPIRGPWPFTLTASEMAWSELYGCYLNTPRSLLVYLHAQTLPRRCVQNDLNSDICLAVLKTNSDHLHVGVRFLLFGRRRNKFGRYVFYVTYVGCRDGV